MSYKVYGTETYDCQKYSMIAAVPFKVNVISLVMRNKLQYHHFFVVADGGTCFSYFPFLGSHSKGDCCWQLEVKMVEPEYCQGKLSNGSVQ